MKLFTSTLLFAALAASLPADAAVSDPNWTETMLSSNPGGGGHTGLAWAPDGSDRLFVLEKNGRVRVMSGALSTGIPAWSTFATMSPIVTTIECGLIGIAFDPDFANNHYVYFFVTVSNTEQQILRYDATTNIGTGRTVIMPGLPTVGQNHDGGGLGFAADGKLYWAVGDLGNGTGVNNELQSLAAKVGRANRDGSLPTNNPFADGAGPNNDFIFARGMRNPFTMQIQPSTGLIWLNVVGDNFEQVFVVRRGDHGGYNTYENNQPAPNASQQYITPTIVYPTSNTGIALPINSAVRSGNVTTFTTNPNHRLRVGSNISVTGSADPSFNGTDLFVTSVLSTTTFTVQQTGANASSAGGTATTLVQGRCLTGGAFVEGTAASAEYRGNFFYGDCVSGRIMRARVAAGSTQVTGVTHWGTGINGQVDMASGPDGALYYTGGGSSTIFRAAFNATSQALVVANQHLRIDEGGDVVTTVRLAIAPVADVAVSVARSDGDADVTVFSGSALTFTPANWNRPQVVRLRAAVDGDGNDDVATVTVSSQGLAAESIAVSVLDLAAADLIFKDGFEN